MPRRRFMSHKTSITWPRWRKNFPAVSNCICARPKTMLKLSLFHSLPHLRNLKTQVCPTRTSRKTTLLEPRDLLFYFRRTSACDIVICNGRLNVQSSRVFKTRNHCFLGRTRLKPLIQWCGWIQLNVQFELNPLLLAENLVDEVKINMPHFPSGENVSTVQKKTIWLFMSSI